MRRILLIGLLLLLLVHTAAYAQYAGPKTSIVDQNGRQTGAADPVCARTSGEFLLGGH